MTIRKSLFIGAALAASMAATSCGDSKSYAELLQDENKATNLFLVNQKVEMSVPADSVFLTGINAPYYQIDEEGNVFMQVINPGTKGNKAQADQLIYFRFTRYSLYTYTFTPGVSTNTKGYYGEFTDGEGNDSDLSYGSASFRFHDTSSSSSLYTYGEGVQLPLEFLPIDCEVNVLIKSQGGLHRAILCGALFL